MMPRSVDGGVLPAVLVASGCRPLSACAMATAMSAGAGSPVVLKPAATASACACATVRAAGGDEGGGVLLGAGSGSCLTLVPSPAGPGPGRQCSWKCWKCWIIPPSPSLISQPIGTSEASHLPAALCVRTYQRIAWVSEPPLGA